MEWKIVRPGRLSDRFNHWAIRRGFPALAVFHGGVDVDAIAAVAGGRFDPVLAMSQLGDSGLVLRAVDAGAWRGRFTVLETVRQLAHEEASSSGELPANRSNAASAPISG